MNETQRPEGERVNRGVALGMLLNIAFVGLWCAVWFGIRGGSWLVVNDFGEKVFFWSLFCIGATQLLYIGPAIWYYQHKQEPGMVKGLIMLAALVALLNGMCWAVVTR